MSNTTKTNNKIQVTIISLFLICLTFFIIGYSFASDKKTTPALASGVSEDKTEISSEEIAQLKAELELLKTKTNEIEKKN